MSGPNLFLLAAPRAGSTQLCRWLDSHPHVAIGPVKEPNHHSADSFDPAYVRRSHLDDVDPAVWRRGRRGRRAQFAVFRDRGDYLALYEGLGARWRCDASTSYLAAPDAPARIAAAHPGARVITLTRCPVSRALSHYRLARRTGRTRLPLVEELAAELSGELPEAARYLLHPSLSQEPGLARVAAAFPAHRRLALRFEEMVAEPAAALARVAGFLGIDPAGFDLAAEGRNAGVAPRFERLNAALQASGAKTRLRRWLPPAAKSRLKRVWFSPREVAIPAHDRARLAALIGAAR